MTDKPLKELANEIDASLREGTVTGRDRELLEQAHTELQTALSAQATRPPGLRKTLTQTIEQLEGEHPRLTSLLSQSLDLLSDIGI